MASGNVLVVGSYPPIPLASSAASIAAVRRAWAEGLEVTVVSPRLSAAHLAVPVAGLLAGRRLANVRRHTGAERAVIVAERGLPVPAKGTAIQRLTVSGLLRSMARFEHVTIVRVGSLGLPMDVESRLMAGANEVLDEPRQDLDEPGVTPLGPPDVLPRERPRQVAGILLRALRRTRRRLAQRSATTLP